MNVNAKISTLLKMYEGIAPAPPPLGGEIFCTNI